jgi:hypothetical protein
MAVTASRGGKPAPKADRMTAASCTGRREASLPGSVPKSSILLPYQASAAVGGRGDNHSINQASVMRASSTLYGLGVICISV